MTPEEKALRRDQRAYARDAAKAEASRKKRNASLLAALASGMTHAKAAAITELSRGRIGQINPEGTDNG